MTIDDIHLSEQSPAEPHRPAPPASGPDGAAIETIGASPIFSHTWPDSARLNAELRRVVLERMAVSPGIKKSNCGGWHSERNLQLWQDPPIEELLERMRAMLRSVIRRTVADPGEELLHGWDIEAWANVNQLGDRSVAHTHAGGVNMWAAIYYVDTGDGGAASSGCTRFLDMSGTPRPVGRSAPSADPVPVVRGDLQDRCARPERYGDYDIELEPVPGKMVVFPASLPHYVTPYLGNDRRITIAFNLRHTRFAVTDFENPYSRRQTLWRDYRGAMLVMFSVKRALRERLAAVVPVHKWPPAVKSKLLGGSSD